MITLQGNFNNLTIQNISIIEDTIGQHFIFIDIESPTIATLSLDYWIVDNVTLTETFKLLNVKENVLLGNLQIKDFDINGSSISSSELF